MTTATATKPKAFSTTTLPRTELLDALVAVNHAIVARSPKPVLQNVRIGDGLITGTDLEVRIDLAISEHCEPFLVPHGRLLAIVRAATGDEVTLKPGKTSVVVTCGGGSWTLPTEDVSEYPTWEPVNLQAVCRLPADQFARAAKATTYATDTESSRYALGAVLLEVKNGNPTWVATDGRRLSLVETETDQAVDDRDVLVPRRVLDIVAGMAGSGSVQVEATASEVRFELEGTTVTGRLVEGRFPRWRDVMGKPEGEPTVLERSDWLAAVRAAAIVTSEQSKGVDLEWTANTLVISGRSAEYGESTVQCDIVAAGTTAPVKLDPRFIVDFLRHLPDDEEPQVNVYVKDGQSRVLITCGPYKGVIMPLAQD
jgi:DNA polymerase III subunit beta